MFPSIDSPCPLKSLQLPESGNFDCSTCKREVHDLTTMNEQQRVDFLQACEGKICVSYSVKKTNHLKKVAMAGLFVVTASGMALPAAAQVGDDLESDFYDEILVGGVHNPKQQALEYSANKEKSSNINELQLIPVIEEDDESGV